MCNPVKFHPSIPLTRCWENLFTVEQWILPCLKIYIYWFPRQPSHARATVRLVIFWARQCSPPAAARRHGRPGAQRGERRRLRQRPQVSPWLQSDCPGCGRLERPPVKTVRGGAGEQVIYTRDERFSLTRFQGGIPYI